MQQQLIIGTLLHGGTYKIEKILGQGSFGITYLAEHTNLGKKVAIKEFFMKELNSRGEDGSITGMSDSSLSQNYCQKFKKEAINLSRLDHPNIVRVTDSFSENGTFYYVMDFIEGQNLNDYIKSHYIDEAEAVSIIKSVADALIYMHEEKHMLHLDLKPGNVMRRNDGHIFLIDFGLSKHYSTDGQPETSTTIGLGTAGYAPIEQGNKAKNGEFRPTIDVYALGATFYKLLTRETPPPASDLVSDDELLENKLREKGVSDNLIEVVTEAMCPNVRRRTQSIKEFKGNLDGIKSETQATINVTSDDTIADTGKEETIVTSAEDFNKAGDEEENEYGNEDDGISKKSLKNLGTIVVIVFVIFAIIGVCQSSLNTSMARDSNQNMADTTDTTMMTCDVTNVDMYLSGAHCVYSGKVIEEFNGIRYLPHEKGQATFNDGRYYEGHFSYGEMDGPNAYFSYPNGDVFVGSFVHNEFNQGKYTVKQTGEYFVGSFKNGQPYNGTWYERTGRKIEDVKN